MNSGPAKPKCVAAAAPNASAYTLRSAEFPTRSNAPSDMMFGTRTSPPESIVCCRKARSLARSESVISPELKPGNVQLSVGRDELSANMRPLRRPAAKS